LKLDTNKGAAFPLGVTLKKDGANFAVWSARAETITVCIFDSSSKEEIFRSSLPGREGDVHFGFISDVEPGMLYGLRAGGIWSPEQNLMFDDSKLLLDPYANEIDHAFALLPGLGDKGVETAGLVPKGVIKKQLDDLPLRKIFEPDFVYELQVKSFTILHPDIPEKMRGTMSALTHPAVLAHLKKIGVDTIELMPITAWIDEPHLQRLGLSNAWGYNPISFFAPDPRLAPGGMAEIRQTVQRLHAEGFNVILDLVFNHTGEGDDHGPVISLHGLDSTAYYRHIDGILVNDTGCGNTVAMDRPHVVQLVIDSLRHWVLKCGIDGFRFDLATVMGRSDQGFDPNAALLQAIENDPVLSTRIMIAEPWDIGPGGYQLGNFPPRWYEWNDKYRDDVRRFWRCDNFTANALATRISGSSDVFQKKSSLSKSLNFISAHDGFTLHDVVNFTSKNNLANGENNRDGKGDEVTWASGDIRALLATLFMSRGAIMLTAGDEFGRTQNGNNNAYCQDNEVTWLNWSNADLQLIEFVAELSKLRKTLPLITGSEFLAGQLDTAKPSGLWFDTTGQLLNWNNPETRFVGLLVTNGNQRNVIIINGSNCGENFPLQARQNFAWKRVFCSSSAPECPAQSISIFVEMPLDQH
jgi:glycogen debranching enzyme